MNAEMMSAVLTKRLLDYGLKGRVVEALRGPSVTTILFAPDDTTRISAIARLAPELSLSLGGMVRVNTMPEIHAVGIEVPNTQREPVLWRQLINETHNELRSRTLGVPLGLDSFGHAVITDIAALPHLLIAGTTGSGKSVVLHSIILSLLAQFACDKLHFVMIDAKAVELNQYEELPHLLYPVITTAAEAVAALENVVAEVERRYAQMSAMKVRNSDDLNMPRIVIIVDELADLMLTERKALERLITRIAQKARAAGVHMILATQRPSVNVVTGIIKANLPARLCFRLPSVHDSRTVLDHMGAEQLLGSGDGLFEGGLGKVIRLQSPFVSNDDIWGMVKQVIEVSRPMRKAARPSWWQRIKFLVKGRREPKARRFAAPRITGFSGERGAV